MGILDKMIQDQGTEGSRLCVRLCIAAVLLLFCSSFVAAQQQSVQSYALNNYARTLDGQWEGIRYASDGDVYFGSSTHDAHHGAAFFKYDPRTKQLTMLSDDITKICGEDPLTNPQGKLHSDIVEANGWLYMSTYLGVDNPIASITYTGSHVIGYELATGNFRDFGVVYPNYTSYSGIGVDPVRRYIYVFVTGENPGQVSYLFRISMDTGEKINLGQVGGTYSASLWFFVDKRGDVWFSVYYQNGDLKHVHGDTGQIDTIPNALPPLYLWNQEQVDPNLSNQSYRSIGWMQPLDGDRALFTMDPDGGMLYMFDSTKPIGQAFTNIKHIGPNELGLAIGNNRVFYYQRANRAYGHQSDQIITGDPSSGNIRDFHLLSVSLDPADGYAITDYGLLQDQDGRVVFRVPSMMTDGANRVFMTGDWWTIPGDLGTLRYKYSNGVESYVQLPRGEFFAVADVGTSGVSVTPPNPTLGQSQMQQFTATLQNSTDQSVSWSINPPVGSISTAGLYIAPTTIATGQTVTVIATSVADPTKLGTATITLQPSVSTIAVTPSNSTIAVGATQQFAATGTYQGGSTQDITAQVSWSSSTAAVTIDTSGLAKGQSGGNTTITAALNGVTGSASATAVAPPPPPPPPPSGGPTGYTFCASENGTCSFTGTMSVAFGANGKFNYQTLTGGTPCTNAVFGDPNYGTAKSCYTQ